MPSKDELKDETNYHSTRISETSRFVGFGLLATYYGFAVSPPAAFVADECLLVSVGVLGTLAVSLDYFQYVCGYAMARLASLGGEPYSYKRGPAVIFYGIKTIAFWGKQAAAVLGSIALIALILSSQP